MLKKPPSQVCVRLLTYSVLRPHPYEFTLDLGDLCAVNSLVIKYKTTACITIAISKSEHSTPITLIRSLRLSLSKERRVPLGTLPCRYILLKFHSGCPEEVQSLKVHGVSVTRARKELESADYNLLLNNTYRILY